VRLLPIGEPNDANSKPARLPEPEEASTGNHMEKVCFIHPSADGFTPPDLPKVFNKTDLMFLVSLLNEKECNSPIENDKPGLLSILANYE